MPSKKPQPGTILVCRNDGNPLVPTFIFPHAVHFCPQCKGRFGMFDKAAMVKMGLAQAK
jgi:hypothetical protein